MNGTEREKVLGTVKTLIMNRIITIRNEVAKVMFLQVCVCPRGRGGRAVLSQHALQVVSQHALQQGVSAPGAVPGLGSAWSEGCLVRVMPGLGRSPRERWLLLQTVRIPLECILVSIVLRHEVSL